MLPWITALKVFNKGSPSWCVPRKGTLGYDTVSRIRQGQEVKTPKQIMDELERKTIGKPKTERRSATISLDVPTMQTETKPKPKRRTIRAFVPSETKAEPKAETKPKKEESEREDIDFNVRIPKDADYDLTDREIHSLNYYKHTKEHRADYERFIKDFKRYGREVVNADPKRKKNIRNVVVYHDEGSDQVTISWGIHKWEQQGSKNVVKFNPVESKIYTIGKALPKDPITLKPTKAEPASIVQKGMEGHTVEGYTPRAVGREKYNVVEVAFFRPGETKSHGKAFFRRESTSGKTASFKAMSHAKIPDALKTATIKFDLA